MERMPTGIANLDKKISGGYPKGKGILITGVPGAGKTIFGLHFLHKSCMDGKKCIMVATEETPEDLLEQASMLGLGLESFLENGTLKIKQVIEFRTRSIAREAHIIDDFSDTEIEIIEETHLDRSIRPDQEGFNIEEIDLLDLARLIPEGTEVAVIDNMGVLAFGLKAKEFRDKFDTLNRLLAKQKTSTLYIMDEAAYEMTHKIADYSTYGAVKLMVKENPYTGKNERFLSIPKMRSTKISLDINVFDITSAGISLKGSKAKLVEL
ncbi:ATPase domain-containing protein [Methanolobus profundi]|uniref:RecA-superfamily ATPase, KaiC/GvpD/RAD55 family n=1 Tax=Methanolobus profundi TaxID=487685 RepID=A0A1I4NU25_9EURY|nr:ATPase domain-containing protein [Methanolobus profundi]SFM18643.1 RecA-superfamily ATPase, KaiC/GvpD/RAD55 family [Methanolobus profundi]